MEQLKKNGFLIAVGAMVVLLLAFAYWHVYRAQRSYRAKAEGLRKAALSFRKYASMKPEQLPTEELLSKRGGEKDKLHEAWNAGEQFYAGMAQKLTELRFQPDGEVLDVDDEAAISSAFATAINQLNESYRKLKRKYVTEVFPPEVVKGLTEKFSDIEVRATFGSAEERREAAARCRIARAVFKAAEAAGWGGMTHIGFERRSASVKKATPKKPRRPSYKRPRRRRRSSRTKKKTAKDVKPVDPRSLYEKVKVTVAGETRFQDLGPFLSGLYLQARDPKDPVLFLLEDIILTKQADRVLKPLYEKQYGSEKEARSAPQDAEVKIPTATVRLTLSALKWKGLPKEEPQP